MVHEDLPLIEFTANDRCDRCGAQAYSLARHEDFGELMFCIHHRRENKDRLLDEGWEIVDDYAGMDNLTPSYYTAPV